MPDPYPEYISPGPDPVIVRKGVIRWLRHFFGMRLEYPLRDKDNKHGEAA